MRVYECDSYVRELTTAVSEVAVMKKRTALVLDELLFYPPGGGQPGDLGSVLIAGEQFSVDRLIKQSGKVYVVLECQLPFHDELAAGTSVRCLLDWDRRFLAMRFHTASHLIMAAARRSLPGFVGSRVEISDDLTSCSLYHVTGKLLGDAALRGICSMMDEWIDRDLPIVAESCASIIAAREIYGTLFRVDPSLRFRAPLRIVVIKDIDANPCGGTHLRSTGRVGSCDITESEQGRICFGLGAIPSTLSFARAAAF